MILNFSFRKNVESCRDNYVKKHSNKMLKSLKTRYRNGGMKTGQAMDDVPENTSHTYITSFLRVTATVNGTKASLNLMPSTYTDMHTLMSTFSGPLRASKGNSSRKRNLCNERDLVLTKASLSKLESHIVKSEESSKRVKLDYDKTIEDIKRENLVNKDKLENMKQKVNTLMNREEYLQQKYALAQKQMSESKISYEIKVNSMQKDNFSLQSKLSELQESMQTIMSEYENNSSNHASELLTATDDINFYKQLALEKDERISNLSAELLKSKENEINYESTAKKMRELEHKLTKQDDVVKLAYIMKTKADAYPKIEKENKDLKQQNHQLRELNDKRLRLEEEHESMVKKVSRLEEKLRNYNNMALENETLETNLNEWNKACSAIIENPSPSLLNATVNKLLQNEELLTNEVGTIKSSYKTLEAKLQTCNSFNEDLKSNFSTLNKQGQDQITLIKRLQRKLMLITMERDSYRNLLNSYESDMTINPATLASERIQKLEEIVDRYRTNTKLLEEELHIVKNTSDSGGSFQSFNVSHNNTEAVNHLKNELKDRDEKLKSLSRENSELTEKIKKIISEIGYDPSKARIMTFSMNPSSIATQKREDGMAALKETNEKLLQRLKLLEEHKGDVSDLTAQVDIIFEKQGPVKSREELKEKLTSAETKNKRMMEAFRKTTNEFREVVYSLLGFKIDRARNTMYKLSSMYAESQDDYLLFEMTEEGALQLLETEFSKQLTDLIENHLQKEGSIPVFLSMLTMDLFSKQTVAITL
ncbi:Mitotic spindle assembly checkpoint protein MAD1 [Nymphon striatum]|nr:Mitotic spindle assembly checkpoint protein MAD1 [Nymphon striatum]